MSEELNLNLPDSNTLAEHSFAPDFLQHPPICPLVSPRNAQHFPVQHHISKASSLISSLVVIAHDTDPHVAMANAVSPDHILLQTCLAPTRDRALWHDMQRTYDGRPSSYLPPFEHRRRRRRRRSCGAQNSNFEDYTNMSASPDLDHILSCASRH